MDPPRLLGSHHQTTDPPSSRKTLAPRTLHPPQQLSSAPLRSVRSSSDLQAQAPPPPTPFPPKTPYTCTCTYRHAHSPTHFLTTHTHIQTHTHTEIHPSPRWNQPTPPERERETRISTRSKAPTTAPTTTRALPRRRCHRLLSPRRRWVLCAATGCRAPPLAGCWLTCCF